MPLDTKFGRNQVWPHTCVEVSCDRTDISMMCSSFEIPGFLMWWIFHRQGSFDVWSHERVSLRPLSFNLCLGFHFDCIKSKKQGPTPQSLDQFLFICTFEYHMDKVKKLKRKMSALFILRLWLQKDNFHPFRILLSIWQNCSVSLTVKLDLLHEELFLKYSTFGSQSPS